MKLFVLLLMATMAQSKPAVADGDAAFYRVDTRTPAHQLPEGVAADAVNKRFEDGRAWPRFGINLQPWGIAPVLSQNMVKGPGKHVLWPVAGFGGWLYVDVAGFVPGQKYYYYSAGNALVLATDTHLVQNRTTIAPGTVFTATQATYVLGAKVPAGQPVTAVIVPLAGASKITGYGRFNDPQGQDVQVLATDDWREGDGEDGGRGRVWKILANNLPVEVPLNGHDLDSECRFIPCFNALVLLRRTNERHYFNASAVGGPGENQIQLNCAPAWKTGDQVYLWGDIALNSNFDGASAPAINSYAYVKNVGGNVVELYGSPNVTDADQQLLFTGAVGRFYLERRAGTPGPFGNMMPPLLAQPSEVGNTLWEVGFKAVPVDLQVTGTTAATGVWTVPNHRLNPGNKVTLANMPAGHTPANGDYYAYPLNDHQVQLFDTEVHALLAANGSFNGLAVISNNNETVPTLKLAAASGLPMPPATEGFYAENQRLVLVNGNSLLISDPQDPLHYTPMEATITANLGESDSVTAISSFIAGDCLVIGKQKSVLALYNFSGGPEKWALRSVTREYGCIAPLSMRQWGNQLVFMSRRGLDSVELTAFGVIVPTVKPISFDMQKYVGRIDWQAAGESVVETWANRLFWGVRLKGLPGTANNALLALNFQNSEPAKGLFAWEGVWTGAGLTPMGLSKHFIAGEERLTFLNAAGQVCWLGDGTVDQPGNEPIADSLTTRIYTGGSQGRKVFLKALILWDTNNALLTVTALTPGHNELTALTPANGLAYDPLAYGAGENVNTAYLPNKQLPAFHTPLRQDYALQDVTELIGGQPDVLQNHSEPFRMREDDWGVQLMIANGRGQARIVSVSVEGMVGPSSDRSRV